MAKAAEPLEGPSVTRLREGAARLGLGLALGFAEAGEDDRFHSTLALFDATGHLLQHYRKVHCRSFEDVRRDGLFTPGDSFHVSDLRHGSNSFRVGGMICFDREVPETLPCLRSLGAELVVCPGRPSSFRIENLDAAVDWTVEIDGTPAASRRLSNGDLRIELDLGRHRIEVFRARGGGDD